MSERPWIDDEISVLRSQAQACASASKIGAMLGRSRNSVIGKANRQGIQLNGKLGRGVNWTPDEILTLKIGAKAGHSSEEIGIVLGRSRATVKLKARREGIALKARPWHSKRRAARKAAA